MKHSLLMGLVSIIMLLSSCSKRQYTCECTSPAAPPQDFFITDTQKNAIKKCEAFSSNTPGSAPTTCNIK